MGTYRLTWGITLLLILLSGVDAARAQIYENVYRPTRPAWQQLETPHFRILFQEGEEAAALRSAWLLEDQYDIVQTLVGGSLSGMPVVLNGQNDLSNGYVTTQNFRIEVEIPRIKSKSMNPSDGNWLNTVMPHELVHALHLNVIPAFGVAGVIRPFSPDLARSMHLAAPLGMIEGIAVFHESHRQYGLSGRGNHPYFTQQFETIYDSRHRWSLGQMLMDPARTWPFDRHYIGGHEFIHWLQYEYGMETTKNTIRFVSRWPFLGYGSALWYHTGKRPSRLYRQFREQHEEQKEEDQRPRKHEQDNHETKDHEKEDLELEDFEQEELEPEDLEHVESGVIGRDVYPSPDAVTAGRVRQPFWISNREILYYSLSYNQRPGIYRYDTRSNSTALFLETRSTDDFQFTLNRDRSRFLYSRYHRHPHYHNHQRMRIHEASVDDDGDVRLPGHYLDRENRRLILVDRIHAPAYGPENTIWALQTHHERNLLVSIKRTGVDTLLIPEQGHLLELIFHPKDPDSLVLLANRQGLQGLWFLHRDDLERFNREPADIAFELASIYDPDWHPDGHTLLFTSDFDGRMNLYEYSGPLAPASGPESYAVSVRRVTNHRYGVMEASWSPDGSMIAAVQLQKNRFELVLLDHDQLTPEEIPADEWKYPPFSGPSPAPPLPAGYTENQTGGPLDDGETAPSANNPTEMELPGDWTLSSYHTGIGWLRPRSVFPYWENESQFIGHRFGAVVSGGDVLRRHSYNAELSTSNNRFWYDVDYRFSGFYPGFRLNFYQRPVQTTDFLLDRQGAGIDIPLQYHIDQNTRSSSVSFVPGIDLLRERIITTGGSSQSDWFQRARASLFVSWQHRLQQNIRDVQPNTGWLLFSEVNQDLQTDAAEKLSALRVGMYRFLTFYKEENWSLRLGIEAVTQNRPYFDISGFYSRGFDERILLGFNNAARLNSRFAIPLWHADRGQVLLPVFLDRFYLVLFSDTVFPVQSRQYQDWKSDSRTLFGGGIRMQFRMFNFPVDIGIAGVYEPTRNRGNVFIGWF